MSSPFKLYINTLDKLILSFGLDPKELQSSELKPGQGELNGQSS